MFEDYTVAVKVKLFNEVSGGLMLMSRQFEALTEKAAIFQGHLKNIQGLMTAGFGMIGGGAALAAPLLYGISKAAELQKQMIGIQIATRGTVDQMDAMRIAMEKAAAPTMFSTLDVAKMGQIIATSNTLTAPQLTSLLPEYAKFADVQLLLKHTPYTTSISEAVRLAHTAKIYDAAGMAHYLDTLTKASIISSGDISEVGTALKYSQGTAQTALGVTPDNMVILTALANRLGFAGSRGGTNLIDAMIRTVPGIFGSGLLTGKSNEALRAMGLTDAKGHSLLFTNGKFDAMKWMEGLSAYVSKEFSSHPEAIARQDILTNFQHAFGAQGRRIATLFADPKALQQFLIMQQQFEQLASNGAIQDQFVQQSVSQQFQTAVTNFQNVMIELGTNLLPLTTHVLNDINHELGIFIPWMREHKELVKNLSLTILGFATTMVATGILTLIASLGVEFLALTTFMLGLYKALTALTSLGSKFGSWLYDERHQNTNGTMPAFVQPQQITLGHHTSTPVIVNHKTIIDGKVIMENVTKHMGEQAYRWPQTGTNYPDPNISPMLAGYNGN
jgi:TP901 family phage tail tape measure protein